MLKRFLRSRNLAIDGKKAHQYDFFTRKYRIDDMRTYAELVADQVSEGGSVLDIATGPGYFCIELAKLGIYQITGLDISPDLIKIALDNARQEELDIDFLTGDASAMQFPNMIFDLIFCSWAMKNFMNPEKVLDEVYRVLKPGGTAIVIDLNHDATIQEWAQCASNWRLSGMTAFVMKFAFRIQRSSAYTIAQVDSLVRESPFNRYDIKKIGINFCVRLTKQ